ncbi:FAD-dependent monooxygenase [Streptomyces platensis]|uniref:FAD-dependent monooxygenase n=1 Tax=Streptomyces platensis TaxID=58346 RepID=UPI002E26C3B7|nr:FAD-dependent monooxygenase [Streptomyces platensis]
MADWNLPWVDLAKLVERSSAIFEYPMLDRDPLPRWSFGRVTLLGDAGHPMFPMGMNGGSRSVVDARVLAWCLAREHDPVTALRRYDTMRRPMVNAIVLANRELGPEKIIARAGERGGALPVDEATETASDYKELPRATVAQGQLPCLVDHFGRGRGRGHGSGTVRTRPGEGLHDCRRIAARSRNCAAVNGSCPFCNPDATLSMHWQKLVHSVEDQAASGNGRCRGPLIAGTGVMASDSLGRSSTGFVLGYLSRWARRALVAGLRSAW